MSPVVSTEYGKTAQVDIPVDLFFNLGKSVKVVGMSKQIDLVGNTDCQKRPNLYHVIDIGCRYYRNAYNAYNKIIARAQRYTFKHHLENLVMLELTINIWPEQACIIVNG